MYPKTSNNDLHVREDTFPAFPMESVLIVDDNDRYAKSLTDFFIHLNIPTTRAYTAKDGYEKFKLNKYTTIISDITMETQTSGLFLVRRIYLEGFSGKLIIATTGFDVPGVMWLGKFFLPWFAGIGWMIPKVPLKKGEVVFVPTKKNLPQPFQRIE